MWCQSPIDYWYLDRKRGGGWERISVRVEQNFHHTLSMTIYKEALTVQRWSDARPRGQGQVVASTNTAESPKQGRRRFNCQVRRNALPIWVWLIYAITWEDLVVGTAAGGQETWSSHLERISWGRSKKNLLRASASYLHTLDMDNLVPVYKMQFLKHLRK